MFLKGVKKNEKNKNLSRHGFSLIEVMIMWFIGLTILLLIFGLTSRSREFARTMVCVNNMRQITQAIENYQADWNNSLGNLADLYSQYVPNVEVLFCPKDSSRKGYGKQNIQEIIENDDTSYSDFYIARFFSEEDSSKISLACPRHFRKSKTITAYLSYNVDIGYTQEVSCNSGKANFGELYHAGDTLRFKDGTVVKIENGQVGLHSSFMSNEDKIYSIIFLPEDEAPQITITHQSDSQFEVITPAVIAGVAGTVFSIQQMLGSTSIDGLTFKTLENSTFVTEKGVRVEERATGRKFWLKANTSHNVLEVGVLIPEKEAVNDTVEEKILIKRKPPRRRRPWKKPWWKYIH